MNKDMSSLQRVLTTLGHQEPDRVPLFLLVTLHGAKELGITIKEYLSRGEHVASGQLRLRARYGHDCLYAFFYAAVETEAWGGEVIYRDDGPPNAGAPLVSKLTSISSLTAPRVDDSPCLLKVLKAIALMKEKIGDEAPIIGVVMSPFSLPVMQLGFDRYIELIYEQPELLWKLLNVNMEFCAAWANAQLAAGATAICYFDPVSSPTIVPREIYLRTGFIAAQQTLGRIKGPTATHFASGRCLPVLDDLARTGTAVVGVGPQEDLGTIKEACRGKLTVLGNLNGIEMRRWTDREVERHVKEALAQAGPGGGFILSDQHGEIPWQVPDDTLMTIAETARKWGRYPLNWITADVR